MTEAPRRQTRQRSAVLALLDELDGFRTAQELHALLRERGDAVGLATVYRALQALVDDGLVDVLRTEGPGDGSAAYRRHALSVLARRTLGWAWHELGREA